MMMMMMMMMHVSTFSIFSLVQNILRYTNVIYNASIPSNDNAVLSSTSPEACAASCDVQSSFLCRSFDFDKRTNKCYLSVKHSPDNLVRKDSTATYNFYELSKY
jgi:hypothetical protein